MMQNSETKNGFTIFNGASDFEAFKDGYAWGKFMEQGKMHTPSYFMGVITGFITTVLFAMIVLWVM